MREEMYVSQVLFTVVWGFILLGAPLWLTNLYTVVTMLSKDVKRRTPKNTAINILSIVVPFLLLPASLVYSVYSIWMCAPQKGQNDHVTSVAVLGWLYFYWCCFCPLVMGLCSYYLVRYLYKAAKKGR